MQRETTIEQKINALQELVKTLANGTGSSIDATLTGMGYDSEERDFIMKKESTNMTINSELRKFAPEPDNIPGFEITLNVKANYEELESLNNLPYNSISDKGNRIIEINTYLELIEEEPERKNALVEKYLDSAGLIGADSIEFYGIC